MWPPSKKHPGIWQLSPPSSLDPHLQTAGAKTLLAVYTVQDGHSGQFSSTGGICPLSRNPSINLSLLSPAQAATSGLSQWWQQAGKTELIFMKLLEKNEVLTAYEGPTPGCQEFQEERNQSEWQRASLVAQWWRIRQVRSLIQEDPTCLRAIKLVHSNYWTYALEPGSSDYKRPCTLEPVLCNKRSPRKEKPVHRN